MQDLRSQIHLIAGPCAAESREQLLATARELQVSGIAVFRAGVWKPRTQPGSFEGVGEPALEWLREVKKTYGLAVATEVATAEQAMLALAYEVDVLWIGARTTTNPFLVQQIADALRGKSCTVLVKNPISPDVNLWQGAIRRMEEAVGEGRVMAVHRGFQTGQPTDLRNAPLWSIAFELKRRMPALQMILDPSHMAGCCEAIPTLSQQALDLGYNGLMVEVHCEPRTALSDANQQLSPSQFADIINHLKLRHEGIDTGLVSLRSEIDEIDDALWNMVLRRMQVSQRIGAYKRDKELPVLQETRWNELVEKRLSWAAANGLSEDAVRRVLDALHEESCRWQL